MKKKKIITIAFIVMVLLVSALSGCSKNANSKATSSDVTPNIVECKWSSDNYYYIVDKNTDVVYICFTDNAYRFGMEVMVNRNGVPVTASELGIKY